MHFIGEKADTTTTGTNNQVVFIRLPIARTAPLEGDATESGGIVAE